MIKKVFPILAVSIFSAMLGSGLIVPLLPLYAQDLGATGTQLGILFAGFSISRSVFTPIIGRLSDRRGRKIFLCLGLLFYSIISLITPAPTVRPPSRMAKRSSFSIAIGVIRLASNATLSPGITISTPSGSFTTPVTSVVRK